MINKQFDRQVNQVKTVEDLRRHASVGKICGCNNCFCCAAKEALERHTASAEQLATLYGEMETIPLHAGVKLGKILDVAPRILLELCVEKQVKFIAPLAARRLKKIALHRTATNYNETFN